MALATAWPDMNPDRAIVIEGMPTYEDPLKNGVGRYLLPVPAPDEPAVLSLAEVTKEDGNDA